MAIAALVTSVYRYSETRIHQKLAVCIYSARNCVKKLESTATELNCVKKQRKLIFKNLNNSSNFNTFILTVAYLDQQRIFLTKSAS